MVSLEVEAFVGDASPDAYSKVVDRLLASPRYGERWGRHWLDVARYGGYHRYGAAVALRQQVVVSFFCFRAEDSGLHWFC